jgi:DNA-binding MarR family transcriptional regulator
MSKMVSAAKKSLKKSRKPSASAITPIEKKIKLFSDGDEYHDLYLIFSHARYLSFRAREKELAKYHLTPEQAPILFIIKSFKEQASPIKIAAYIFRQRHSVSTLVQRMEKKGLILKTKDLERKNMVRVSLTDKGRKAYELSSRRDSTHHIMGTLNKAERRQFLGFLRRIMVQSQIELGEVEGEPR